MILDPLVFCCEVCNNKLGKEIDEPLASKFEQVSTVLGISKGRRSVAKLNNVAKKDGFTYGLKAGGLYISKYPSIELSKKNDCLSYLTILRDSESEAGKLVGQRLSASDLIDGEVVESTIDSVFSILEHKETLNFSFSISDRRSLAKILLTELSKCISPERLRSGVFQGVIDFVAGRDSFNNLLVEPIHKSKLLNSSELGECQHTTYIRFVPNVGCLGALSLFDTFTFGVVLSREWNGVDRLKIHRLNPLSGEVRNEELLGDDLLASDDWDSWIYSSDEFSSWKPHQRFFDFDDLEKLFSRMQCQLNVFN